MATITQGMFGVTPEELMSQRQQALNAQALSYAQLDPMQQAQMSFYKAGSQLGTGLGGLMGAQDPELMRVRQRQQMLQGLDLTNPESLLAKAQEASQMGDYQAAQELYNKAQEMAKAAAERKLKESQAEYYTRGGRQGTAQSPYGKIIPSKYTPESLQAFDETVQAGTPNYSLLDPVDPVEKAASLSPAGRVARDSGFVVGTPEFAAEVKRLAAETTATKLAPTTFKREEVAKKEEINKQATKDAGVAAVGELDTALANIAEARKRVSPLATGWGAAVFENMPSSDAMALKDIVKSLNSESVLTQMKQLKEASKTGATGFGSMAVKEVELLESRIRALNPKSKTFVNDLSFVENSWKNIRTKIAQELDKQQQQSPQAPAKPANVDYNAAFERAKKLDPRWSKYTLEQFKQAAGAR